VEGSRVSAVAVMRRSTTADVLLGGLTDNRVLLGAGQHEMMRRSRTPIVYIFGTAKANFGWILGPFFISHVNHIPATNQKTTTAQGRLYSGVCEVNRAVL